MRRRRIGIAVLLSLLLHVVAGVLLWRMAERNKANEPLAQAPIEFEFIDVPPPAQQPKPPAATEPPPATAEQEKPAPKQHERAESKHADRTPAAPEKSPAAEAPAPPPPPARGSEQQQVAKQAEPPEGGPGSQGGADTPSATNDENGIAVNEGDAQKLNLLPKSPFAGLGSGSGPGPDSGHGHTLHPDDPEFSPEVKRLEEEHRVAGRVNGWANDALAEARAGVSAGGGHPYFADVSGAMRGGLKHEKGGTPAALGAAGMAQQMFNRWKQGMSEYAKTGNPNLAPPGQAPRQSERQKEIFGSEGQWAQGLAQGMETQEDLKHGVPLLSVTFELLQGSDGHYKDGRILEGSGSAKFDAFVVRVIPGAINQMGPPPAEVLHGRDEVRSVWKIEGWQAYTMRELQMPSMGLEGIPLDRLGQPVKPEDRQFDFHAKLLRAY